MECQRSHKDVVQGDGHVHTEVCMFCHSDFNRIAKVRDPERLHDVHVTEHKVECFECHSYIKHEVAKTVDVVTLNCDICHANKHLGPRASMWV